MLDECFVPHNINMTDVNDVNMDEGDSSQSQWTAAQATGKRKISPGRRRPIKQKKLSDYWLGVPVTNRYDHLCDESTSGQNSNEQINENQQNQQNQKNVEPPKPRPPPIFVYNVEQVNPLITLLNEMAPKKYTLRVLANNQVKIQLETIEAYKAVLKILLEKKTELHSFQIKSEKTFRVVLRNLHHSIDVDDLKAELAEKDHTVVNVLNVRHKRTKEPLPMFYLNLAPKSNNKEIYNIRTLMNCVVKFEPPYAKKEIRQCTRCQGYNHTKTFCTRAPQCVKCMGSHLTEKCTRKERSTEVQCVNCGGAHTANYRGCQAYQDLRKKLFPTLRDKRKTQRFPHQHTPVMSAPEPSTSRSNGVSFRDVLIGESSGSRSVVNLNAPPATPAPKTQQSQQSSQSSGDMNDLKEMMKMLTAQVSSMCNMLTMFMSKFTK